MRQPRGPFRGRDVHHSDWRVGFGLHVGMKVGCVTRVEDKEVFDSRTNNSRRQQRAQVVTTAA